jgi:hypothetical protein
MGETRNEMYCLWMCTCNQTFFYHGDGEDTRTFNVLKKTRTRLGPSLSSKGSPFHINTPPPILIPSKMRTKGLHHKAFNYYCPSIVLAQIVIKECFIEYKLIT